MDFNTAFEKYKGYMSQIAIRIDNWDNLNAKADVVQELSVVLWHCLERYSGTDDKSLDKILKSAFHNKVVNLLKSKRIERQGLVSIDSMESSSSSSAAYGKKKKFADTLSKHIMTDKDYSSGINEILSSLSPDSAMKAMDVLNPDNRGIFIKGTRKAYGEVKSYLQKG